MIHPDTDLKFISNNIGHGVFATRLIRKGTITWVRDALDLVLTPEDMPGLSPLQKPYLDKYAFIDKQGRYMLCWDNGRFVNHSCFPSTLPFGTICDVAARDIFPGQELTYEYAILNIQKSFSCCCDTDGCRGIISAGDIDIVAPIIDKAVNELLPMIKDVPQPLLSVTLPGDLRQIQDILSGKITLLSCKENKYIDGNGHADIGDSK